MTFLLRYGPMQIPYETRTQAIRGLARAIRNEPGLTRGERHAFDHWYTYRNYRSVALHLYYRRRFELRVSIGGQRRTFSIDPPAPHPGADREVITLSCDRVPARDRSEAPD